MILKKIKKIKFNNFNSFKIKEKYIQKNTKKIFFFKIFNHKKLQYTQVLFNNKLLSFSFGRLVNKVIGDIKSFKRTKKMIPFSVIQLNSKTNKSLHSICWFYCKNFNYKNYLWIKKFYFIISPIIDNLIVTNNWQLVFKKKRRIKKKIYKNLLNASKFT